MNCMPVGRCRPFPTIQLPDRQWPNRTLEKAPQWCSVDLRDGNQALAQPMNVAQKLEMFEALVRCGFKEIEVGFPAASNTEFEFVRRLIEDERIPADVTIQVCRTSTRRPWSSPPCRLLLGGTSASSSTCTSSTSPAQRRVVFGLEKADIVKIATRGTQMDQTTGCLSWPEPKSHFEYSPEEVSPQPKSSSRAGNLRSRHGRCGDHDPTIPHHPSTLPETVGVAKCPMSTPIRLNGFCRNFASGDCAHHQRPYPQRPRHRRVASTELRTPRHAHDRVEGTLFGNGERTRQPRHLSSPSLSTSTCTALIADSISQTSVSSRKSTKRCTGMSVDPRHPYAGDLVFTAFRRRPHTRTPSRKH